MIFQLIAVLLGSVSGFIGFFKFRKDHAVKNQLMKQHEETVSETLQEKQQNTARRSKQLSWLCLTIAVLLPIGWFLAIL